MKQYIITLLFFYLNIYYKKDENYSISTGFDITKTIIYKTNFK